MPKGSIGIGQGVKSKVAGLVAMLLLIILLINWFFPTLNGASGLNNTTKIEIAGVDYGAWFTPAIIIVILIIVLLWFVDML